MNKKRIREHLQKVFESYIGSIEDGETRKLVEKNTIITGGSLVSLLQSDQPKDYDFYFRNKETVLAVSRYYVKKFNEKNTITNNCGYTGQRAFVLDGALPINEQIENAGETVWESQMLFNLTEDRVKIIVRSDGVAEESPPLDPVALVTDGDDIPIDVIRTGEEKKKKEKPAPYRPIFLSTNAITLSDKIQLIIRFYGEPGDIHSTYDFVHCCNYWCSWEPDEVHLDTEALEAILNKELVYRGSKYPICSIFRIRKFLNRGWHINAGQILKICFQISTLDLTDIDVLEDQLVGVDTLYFAQFIELLQEAQRQHAEQGVEFQITPSYVESIVDKIFG